MTARIPTMDDVHPEWRGRFHALLAAELEVSLLAKGTPERRAASKRASTLARQWRRMLDDVRVARSQAGWFQSSPLSWVHSGGER